MSTKENITKQKAPRRSRLPGYVYKTADGLQSGLTDYEAISPNAWIFKGDRTDEILCREALQPLRNISSLAFQKELDPTINEHLHNDPHLCRRILLDAMRLAYGIQDLIDAGEKVSKFERARCANLKEYYKEISGAVWESGKRQRGEAKKPKAETTSLKRYRAAFEWSLFGLHHGDSVTVNENGQAKPGQLILVRSTDGSYEDSYFTRCCLVTSDTVRVCAYDGESYDRPASAIIGAAVKISHDDCNHTKAEALRAQIKKLQSDSDAWSNVTRVYELETEIFELEHPIEEEEDSADEWPEVIDNE
jgi:hypothetical protein